ncbi:MAG: c-type cytochrome [Nitrospinota bacterium]|nr:c-type cytochrome [Nitrospinota bacterium]
MIAQSKPRNSQFSFLLAALLLLTLPSSLLGFTAPTAKDIPKSIMLKGKEFSLENIKNPFSSDPGTVKEGGEIYIKNCFLCHGDLLDGKGLFGESFFPAPANFTQKNSVVSKTPAYAFWRIMKGGKGLPERFKPWNSAMPAWEEVLSQEEVWKTILYINKTVKERRQPIPKKQNPSIKHGKNIYLKKCAFCHGEKGKGDGPSKEYTLPHPRNLTKGHIKIRSTSFGKIPTDEDLFDAVSNGMKGTTMPSWSHLSNSDRQSLVLYIKSLSKKFKKFKKRGKKHKIITVPELPTVSQEGIERGKKSFMINCSGCHGVKGRGDGVTTARIVDYSSNAIWPRNLSEPWNFRRGATRKDIFLTLRTGLSTTAMPKFSPRIFKDQEIWDVVDFVLTLGSPKQPQVKPVILAKKTSEDLPDDFNASFWTKMKSAYIPLGGQILQKPKSYFPTVRNLTVRAAYNDKEIAFKIDWDDPSYDPALQEKNIVKASPTPPLPEHLKGAKEEEPIEPIKPDFPDALALQFNLNNEAVKPYFLNGDSSHPVNLWKWTSSDNTAHEWNATGLTNWSLQNDKSQSIKAQANYQFGRYFLIIKRKLKVNDEKMDVQFEAGKSLLIAFNIWDGYQGENGAKKSISSWFELQLAK